MFPIYACYDSSVTQKERQAIEQGLKEAESLFGCKAICYGTNNWVFGSYKNADQLVNSMLRNDRGQINASILMDKLAHVSDSWMEPGALILLTGVDMYSQSCNWCFGIAKASSKMAALSVNRLRELDSTLESICIRRTIKHEIGHIFCCPSSINRSNTEMRAGIHCTNNHCSMRQAVSLNELVDAALGEDARNCFCPQCMQDLRKFKRWYEAIEEKGTMVRPMRRFASAACGSATRRKK